MFEFKQFAIEQDKTSMKVGTDGVLIGAWAAIAQTDRYMLDIGAGTALIALMLAQRNPLVQRIDAVEIDADSAMQAKENCAKSPWSQIINIHNISIAEFDDNIKYDCIVSNPPYFCDSLHSPNAGRTTARHTLYLSFSELVDSVLRLLSAGGRFSLILPTAESELFERVCAGKLYLWRRCLIYSRVGSKCIREMSEYRLNKPLAITKEELSIRYENSNEYTPEYKTLTADFYLKF